MIDGKMVSVVCLVEKIIMTSEPDRYMYKTLEWVDLVYLKALRVSSYTEDY